MSAATPRPRPRHLVLLAFGGALVALLVYRRRAFARRAEEFHERYG